jgi:hypothetical protein
MVKRTDKSARDRRIEFGRPALHFCAFSFNSVAVEFLHEFGSNIYVTSEYDIL